MRINSYVYFPASSFWRIPKFMKKRARYFLDKSLVHVVASDMHRERHNIWEKLMNLLLKNMGRRAREGFLKQTHQNYKWPTNLGEMMKEQDKSEIDVLVVKVLWKRKFVIVLVALLAGIAAFV